MKKPNTKTRNNKKLLIIGLIIVLVSAAVGIYFLMNRPTEEPVSVVSDPDFNDGTPREPGSSVERNGGVTPDENPDSNPPQNDPIVSSSGNISVYEPRPNQIFKPGDKLYGTAEVDTIWYRLMDDQIGMITQGSIEVKDGRFSGTFNFSTDGTKGRLDIFRMTESGLEADNIEIDIKFK